METTTTYQVKIINGKLIIVENGMDIFSINREEIKRIFIIDKTSIVIEDSKGKYLQIKTDSNEVAKELITKINETLRVYEKLLISKITVHSLHGGIDQILLSNILTLNFNKSSFHASDLTDHKLQFLSDDEITSGNLKKYTVVVGCIVGSYKFFFTNQEYAMEIYNSLNVLHSFYLDLVSNFSLDDKRCVMDNTVYRLEQK